MLIGSYALALFVPIYLELSRRLALAHRRLGMVTAVTGLFGATAGFSMEFLRLVEHVGGFAWALTWAYPGACGLWLVAQGRVAAGHFE